MLAARWHGRLDVRVEELPVPSPGPGEVLLAVGWCGICGTDVEEYRDGPVVIPVGQPHPLTGRMAPLTLGHEFAGTVLGLGSGVGGLEIGERVAVEVCLSCGACSFCLGGLPALCIDWAAYGLQANGGLAEAVVVRADHCVPLPQAIDDRAAALIEPTEVAVRAVRKLDLRTGESAVVLGGGTIGLLSAQVLRAHGAGPVLVVSGNPAGSATAAELGLEVVDSTGDWPAAVRARLGGLGPDVVLECQGRAASARDAILLARKGGRIVLLGLAVGDQPIDLLDVVLGEKVIIGSVQHELDLDLRPALDLLATGAVRVEPLVTGVIELDRVVPDGFEATSSNRKHVKTLVRTH